MGSFFRHALAGIVVCFLLSAGSYLVLGATHFGSFLHQAAEFVLTWTNWLAYAVSPKSEGDVRFVLMPMIICLGIPLNWVLNGLIFCPIAKFALRRGARALQR